MEPVITVGLDGSPESLAAAHWAADEAERRKVTLRLLHAWPQLVPEPTRVPAELDHNYWAKRIVQKAREELQARHPGLTILTNLVAEDAETALLQAASESQMLVVGSRGLALAESYFLGDISMSVVARAEQPVVLVRAGAREQEPSSASGGADGVVVALKLHGPSDELLGFAFRAAAERGVPLEVVHGVNVPLFAYVPWGLDHNVIDAITKDTQKHLGPALRSWREKFPGVEVTDSLGFEGASRAVVQAAQGAGLLVVGRRRHRPPLPRLGPVTQAAIHHARCPVAVVPHD
ncbi:universal stress protein [Streptomyces sp. WM6378]|uniref:universal stress protein n=1 Tax=Streptomyces sp. WM6378 TaxID=1415557 RepID=UPI0006AFB25D|nr:universal stress protein [Streptomyces sp. WM6378]KOU36245.1 stress-inducible protein [Streptomyces sp. WM6378]